MSNRQQQLYFQQQKQHYCIDAKFREMVTFHALNLVGDLYPADMTGLDLIICRNVFIYFDAAAIATVINPACIMAGAAPAVGLPGCVALSESAG